MTMFSKSSICWIAILVVIATSHRCDALTKQTNDDDDDDENSNYYIGTGIYDM
jgi:hypothetical protein